MCLPLSVLLSLLSLATAQDNQIPGAAPLAFGEGSSKQTYSRLVSADLPELHTVAVYAKAGIVPPQSKGLVIVLGGTSGRITSEYGLKPSLAPVVNELVKRGYAAIGFQQPIYWQANADEGTRRPFLERYSRVEAKIDWLSGVTEFALARARRFAPQAAQQVFALGRSTGAADFAEAFHRRYHSSPQAGFVRHFSAFLLMGLDGHREEEIAHWHEAERDFFIQQHPEKGDLPVVLSAPQLFRGMRWETERAERSTRDPLPTVYLTMGARDEFSPTAALEMPIRGFVGSHPEAHGVIVKHDGFHDLSRGIPGVAAPMERMKTVLDRVLSPAQSIPREAAGFSTWHVPDETHFSAGIRSNPRNCNGPLSP